MLRINFFKTRKVPFIFFGVFTVALLFTDTPSPDVALAYGRPYFQNFDNFSFFGYSPLGESMRALLIWGFWQTVFIAVFGRLLALFLVFFGVSLASAGGGLFYFIISRASEAFMSLPSLLIALSLGFILGEGPFVMILVIGLSEWAFNQKWMLGRLNEYQRNDFVAASKMLGAGKMHIFFRQFLPFIRQDLSTLFFLYLPGSLLTVAALEFLGLSTGASVPGLGYQISLNKDIVFQYPHTVLPPVILIVLLVFMANKLRGDT